MRWSAAGDSVYRIRPLPRIYVLSGPDLGRTFDIAAGATFGRAAECAVPLHDASVSRAHARLERTTTGWRVVDVGSRNGLFVGRDRIPAHDLGDGDEFRLGEVLLRFRDEIAAPVIAPTPAQPTPAQPAPAEPAATSVAPEMHFRPMGHSTGPSEETVAEIELEGDWSVPAPVARATPEPAFAPPPSPAQPTRSAPVAAPRSAAVDSRARKMAAAGLAPATRTSDGRGVLQYNKVEQRDGLLEQDFGQQPTWLRAVVVVVLLAAAAGLAWVAYRAANAAKAQIAPPQPVEDDDGSDR